MELTAKTIDTVRLPPGKSEVLVTDSKIAGFGMRVRSGGSRVLLFSYKFGTKNRRLTLGPAIKEAFPDVRKRALELLSQVRLGHDPAAEKDAAKAAAARQQAESFKAIADLYLAKQEKSARPRTYKEEKRYLLVKAKTLHPMPIASITRREVAGLLMATEANVVKGTGASTANRLRAILSAMFSWAMREGLCEANPVLNTNKRAETGRKRVLPVSELVEIWQALPADNFGAAMKLLMLTGQRRNEIGGLRWSEIDDGVTRVTLPPERLKNKGGKERRPHIVPLSEPARDILSRCYRVVGWECVFSSTSGLAHWGRCKADLDAKLTHLSRWTVHDIRRSVATHMADDLGVLPHVVEAVLNHYSGSKSGVAGIYNHAKYLKEVTHALVMWGEHLMAAVSGNSAKVVPLRNMREG